MRHRHVLERRRQRRRFLRLRLRRRHRERYRERLQRGGLAGLALGVRIGCGLQCVGPWRQPLAARGVQRVGRCVVRARDRLRPRQLQPQAPDRRLWQHLHPDPVLPVRGIGQRDLSPVHERSDIRARRSVHQREARDHVLMVIDPAACVFVSEKRAGDVAQPQPEPLAAVLHRVVDDRHRHGLFGLAPSEGQRPVRRPIVRGRGRGVVLGAVVHRHRRARGRVELHREVDSRVSTFHPKGPPGSDRRVTRHRRRGGDAARAAVAHRVHRTHLEGVFPPLQEPVGDRVVLRIRPAARDLVPWGETGALATAPVLIFGDRPAAFVRRRPRQRDRRVAGLRREHRRGRYVRRRGALAHRRRGARRIGPDPQLDLIGGPVSEAAHGVPRGLRAAFCNVGPRIPGVAGVGAQPVLVRLHGHGRGRRRPRQIHLADARRRREVTRCVHGQGLRCRPPLGRRADAFGIHAPHLDVVGGLVRQPGQGMAGGPVVAVWNPRPGGVRLLTRSMPHLVVADTAEGAGGRLPRQRHAPEAAHGDELHGFVRRPVVEGREGDRGPRSGSVGVHRPDLEGVIVTGEGTEGHLSGKRITHV